MESRLLAENQVGAGLFDGLFAASFSEDERLQMLQEAYRLHGRRKAFRLPKGTQGFQSIQSLEE